MTIRLIPLADKKELNEECINLLNEEWPRSYTSREHSQQKSCRLSPPMSLLFLQDEQLIGHSRICKLPNRADACWLESVIVKRSHRGRGLGKLLMLETEASAKTFGYLKVYLSTHDQIAFYESCGYSKCDPILHSTTSTSVFLPSLSPIPSPQLSSSHPTHYGTPSPFRYSIPPPPPPPPHKSPDATFEEDNIQYMSKMI